MTTAPDPGLATGIDALSGWRGAVTRRLDDLARFLGEHGLADAASETEITGLRERLAGDKLVLAFVAEFSRGKSELINAIFFADTGRRMLPATPGRTTMCPVELGWQADEAPSLRLLPIETRLHAASLAELRRQRGAWTELPLPAGDPDGLADVLKEVTRTRVVTQDVARQLGFWDDERADDNPPLRDDGLLDLPAWRHAVINYPHPLLRRGLVVLDTPGLNAVGAEPELTLALLPSAHATVFVLGADTGVTRSDLGLWRDHLGSPALTRFVVLNKIDTLVDSLIGADQLEEQIASQRRGTARMLDVPLDRVFALSARQALAARISGNDDVLAQSGLLQLEAALAAELLPARRQILGGVVQAAAQQLDAQLTRRFGNQRRQLAEQMLELRGLRGKSSGKLRQMLQRVDSETAEFEDCTNHLQAMRAVHGRMLKAALAALSADRLRDEVDQAEAAMTATLLNRGARRAFADLCERLRAVVMEAHQRGAEIRAMLAASYARLNAEFGFGLALGKSPAVDRFVAELAPIESNVGRYLGLGQSLRLSSPPFMAQFRRMLVSRLRVVFEGASAELEQWSTQASAQLESQLRERRRSFLHRREALERVQVAASELELRIVEMEAEDQRLLAFAARWRVLVDALRDEALGTGDEAAAPAASLPSLPLRARA